VTTTPDPAAELRAAANRLRELAGAATPGRWRTSPGNKVSENVMARGRLVIDGGGQSWPDGKSVVYGAALTADAEYIAGMHPGVALTLADWLEAAADRADGNPFGAKDLINAALAVARTYLESAPVAQIPEDTA
jgi:hypothetical protein